MMQTIIEENALLISHSVTLIYIHIYMEQHYISQFSSISLAVAQTGQQFGHAITDEPPSAIS